MEDNEIAAYKRRLYVEANKEKMRAYLKAWQLANADKFKASMRKYYLKNREKIKAKTSAWQKANPEKVKAYARARYLRVKAARLAAAQPANA
jgi:hypothetical protein